jgi:vanillate O-demethylase ferredoxin subunit
VITFRHPRRAHLPAPEPGAHVDLHLPDGRVRQYSLCGDPDDDRTYTIAVRIEPGGRGGSRWVHEALGPGRIVPVSAPRNHFPLADGAAHHVLVAGGIGITPIAAMAQRLAATRASFELHYCAPDAGHAPLLERLRSVCGPRLKAWFTREPRPSPFDPAQVLARRVAGAHLYACGPRRLVDAVLHAAARWPADAVHQERFEPLDDAGFVPDSFSVVIASTGRHIDVPADRSLLEALRTAGFMVPSSCGIGVCGACECGFRAEPGSAPIHRDVVLGMQARTQRIMPCVSRASGRIVLDL